jgi:hypothetical protein
MPTSGASLNAVLFDIFYKRLAACYNGQVPVSTDFGAE